MKKVKHIYKLTSSGDSNQYYSSLKNAIEYKVYLEDNCSLELINSNPKHINSRIKLLNDYKGNHFIKIEKIELNK